MALVYLGSVTVNGYEANVTPLSGSVTLPVGTTYAVAMLQIADDLGQPDTTSITLDGVAMASLGAQTDSPVSGVPTTLEMFALENPTAGSSITCTANFNLPPFTGLITIACFSGQDTTTPTEGFKSSNGTSTAPVADVTTTTVSGDIVLAHIITAAPGIADVSTSDTQLSEIKATAAVDGVFATAYATSTGSGTEVNWTTPNDTWVVQAIVIKAAAGAASQDLTPSLFTNSNSFYTPNVTRGEVELAPSLFTNNNTFYTHALSQTSPLQELSPTLFTNANTFYGLTVSAGAVELTPNLYVNDAEFYSPLISLGAIDLQPSLFVNESVIYSGVVTSSYELAPSLFSNNNAFYTQTVTASYTVTPSLFNNESQFFDATVSVGGLFLSPSLFTNTQSFFAHSISIDGGPQLLTADLFTNDNEFFAATVSGGNVDLIPDLFTNEQVFYSATISAVYEITASLYNNSQTFYSATLTNVNTLQPALFTNTSSFFSAAVIANQTIEPSLFLSLNTFYPPVVDLPESVIAEAETQVVADSPDLGAYPLAGLNKIYPITVINSYQLLDKTYPLDETTDYPLDGIEKDYSL